MNHHHQKVLEALFAHPISANIDFKAVEHMLADLGAEIEEKSGNKIGVSLNGQNLIIHRPHQHTMNKDEVAQLRDFLDSCGVAPSAAA